VYIVNLYEENLRNLEDIRQSQLAAEALMTDFAEHPERYQKDLASDQAIASYYRRLYANLPVNGLNYPLPRWKTTLFSLLSINGECRSRSKSLGKYFLAQAFQTAGREFRVFDDNTVDVLVPYGDGEGIIAELGSDAAKDNLLYRKQLLDKAKRFSISLYDYELAALQKSGGLARLYDSIYVLQPGSYSEDTGFDLHGDGNGFLEV
jgi:CRISPR-associated endonuclease/helicase Cas3